MIYIVSLVYDDIVDELEICWGVFIVYNLFINCIVVLVGDFLFV